MGENRVRSWTIQLVDFFVVGFVAEIVGDDGFHRNIKKHLILESWAHNFHDKQLVSGKGFPKLQAVVMLRKKEEGKT